MNIHAFRKGFPGRKYLKISAAISIVGGAAIAAALFIANNQPWGFIAPPALSGANFSRGNVVAYAPWFEIGSFRGDLLALPVGAAGNVQLVGSTWSAATVLDTQHYLSGRRIVTTDGNGKAIPFEISALTAGQQLAIGSGTILNYVRGDRSQESSGLRVRSSVLGDIIHSTPVFVGKPSSGYSFDNYLAFAHANASRAPQVYVGANDGMLHAFTAATGNEAFAYIPSMVISNLPKLAIQPYNHQYFVDGFLTVEDAQFSGSWHTVLVGGLGAGGKGMYALDVTDPTASDESMAADKILWEFHRGSDGAANLGYTYSRPSIVRLSNGDWGAVFANGYLSGTGAASLFILDIKTGSVIREIIVSDLSANGLSSPTVIDSDKDGMVDTAYAGDLNGNLWKFDLSSGSPGSWSVAYGGQPLFRTAFSGSAHQAITAAPEVGRHPTSGVLVYVGTGRLLSFSDGIDKTVQGVYGIWDDDWNSGVPISTSELLQQTLVSQSHSSGQSTRTASAHTPDWSTHRGWSTPTQVAGASSLDQGERVIQDLLLRDGRISFMSVNPTIPTGENWFIQLDAVTGGAPGKTIVDVNSDLLLDIYDNVDGNGDGVIQDIPADRVVGQYQSFGLASRPVVGILDSGKDAALVNHLAAITPNTIPSADDPGLLGGHFDLDTSRLIYPFSAGTTDAHVHQWDDKYDLTTVDYMDIAGNDGLGEINHVTLGVAPNEVFMLTIANNDLSPGGVLEINSTTISVGDYRNLVDRYLSGSLLPDEIFPRYKLTAPTAFEAAQGIAQLTSLKMSFDAFAILSGDLIPTETGCVRSNEPGALGEYRNGALLIQALSASNVGSGFVFDPATQQYVAGSAAVHATLGYATNGLMWESTLFWHWKGGCYGEPTWAPLYESCIVQGGGECLASSENEKDKGKKKKKNKKKDKDNDAPPPPDGVAIEILPGVVVDPAHTVTNTTIGGSNDAGRIFWKELVPQ